LTFSKEFPTVFLMVGLQGSGKTTTSGKLALWLAERKRRPMLVSTDVYRPAAREQLAVIAKATGIPIFTGEGINSPIQLAMAARKDAADRGHDVLIIDTAGRLHIDQELMNEVGELRTKLRPSEVLLVADAMIGQDAVRSAQEFHERLGTTGVILTKLDGDARGGAALSMREVTRRPIKFAGVGEKLDQFEPFYPDRLAGRILGMGDVVGLVEKAAEAIDEEEAARMERKLRSATFDFNDFLSQFKMLKKLGPLENVLGMLPGMSNVKGLSVDEKQMKRVEAIVLSMTAQERQKPDVLNARRRQRIARGSGTSVTEVNDLLQRFNQMRKLMKNAGKLKKMMARSRGAGGMP
jgi:signal recognition particle subunit SRP54